MRVKSLWATVPLARLAMVTSTVVAFSYAATEVLFPAWVAVAFGTKQMAYVLIVAVLGYFLGYLAGGTDMDTVNIIYNVADLVNKTAFGLAIWAGAKMDSK